MFSSFPCVHQCHDNFNYITGHSGLSDDALAAEKEVSLPTIEIMDAENTFSLKGKYSEQKVLFHNCVEAL